MTVGGSAPHSCVLPWMSVNTMQQLPDRGACRCRYHPAAATAIITPAAGGMHHHHPAATAHPSSAAAACSSRIPHHHHMRPCLSIWSARHIK